MDHLSMVAKAAKASGMSYGKYVALEFERNGYMSVPREEKAAEAPAGEVRRCEICGILLKPGTHGLRTTCSRACSEELNRRRNAGYYRSKKTEGTEDIRKSGRIKECVFPERKAICRNCGAEFSLNGIHGGRKYCSERCRKDYANRAARQRYTLGKAARREKPKQVAACGVCGNKFPVSRNARKYCTDECARAAMLSKARVRDAKRRAKKKEEECLTEST